MHYQRLKTARRKARKVYKYYHDLFPENYLPNDSKEDRDRFLGVYRKTKVPCSCWACGNPRKHFNEKTVQEKKADEDYRQQLNDLLL